MLLRVVLEHPEPYHGQALGSSVFQCSIINIYALIKESTKMSIYQFVFFDKHKIVTSTNASVIQSTPLTMHAVQSHFMHIVLPGLCVCMCDGVTSATNYSIYV